MSLETNLWGELPKPGMIRTPLVILREQAAMLGEMTNRILEAEVEVQKGMLPSEFIADLDIVAPSISSYRITIAMIKYSLTEVYPVELFDILAEGQFIVHDEAEFIRDLKSILSSKKVQRIINSLRTQIVQSS